MPSALRARLHSVRAALGPQLGAAAAMTAGLLVLDLALRRDTVGAYSPLELRQYRLSALGSLGLWWGLFALAASPLRRWWLDALRLLVLGGLGVGLLYVPLASFLTYRRFPNEPAFVFFANEWRFVFRTAGSMLERRPSLVLLAVVSVVAALGWWSRRAAPSRTVLRLALLGLGVEVVGIGGASLSPSMPLLADGNSVRFLARLARWHGAPPAFFEPVERLPPALPHEVPPLPFNVLWVVHETLGGQYLETPTGHAVAPTLVGLRADGAVRWFSRLHSVSSCTDVSVPAMLSGVSSAAAMPAQKQAWLPFDLAREAGAFTFVASSQRMNWANFRGYLGAERFARFKAAEDFQADADDDVGVADVLAYREALTAMDAAQAEGRRFVGLVRPNATHGPYQVDPHDLPFSDDAGFGLGDVGGFVRYLNSVHFADREFGAFWAEFARRGFFEDTLVIITADHGEAFGQHGLWAHCGNFFPEESHVPGVLRLPRAWREDLAHAEALANLASLHDAFLGTTDLVPTVADLVGWHDLGAAQWDGHSWLRPMPPQRRYVFSNCSDLRGCAIADLGFAEGGLRWVYSGDARRWQAFDEQVDPRALHDVAPAHQAELTRALEALSTSEREGPVVRRILRR